MANKIQFWLMRLDKFLFSNQTKKTSKQLGLGIIEIVVTLATVSIIIVSIGKVLNTTLKLIKSSELRTKAIVYAQNALEVVTDQQKEFFVCIGNGGTCTASDGQACTTYTGYTSCWTTYPIGFNNQQDFAINKVGGVWQLAALSAGDYQVLDNVQNYQRKVTITNAYRDASNNLAETGTLDPGSKYVSAEVRWQDGNETKSVVLKTLLTAWQNYE